MFHKKKAPTRKRGGPGIAVPEARESTKSRKSDDPRRVLNEKFVSAVCTEFEKHGASALEEVRRKRPWDFLRCVGAVQNKTAVNVSEIESLTYAQIETEVVAELRQLAAYGVDLHALFAAATAGVETEPSA